MVAVTAATFKNTSDFRVHAMNIPKGLNHDSRPTSTPASAAVEGMARCWGSIPYARRRRFLYQGIFSQAGYDPEPKGLHDAVISDQKHRPKSSKAPIIRL